MKGKIHIFGLVTIIGDNLERQKKYVNTDDIRGIVLRCHNGYSYYFDSNGIYSKTSQDKMDDKVRSISIEDVTNYNLIKKIISELKLGDPISKIFELTDTTKLERHELPQGIDRFITLKRQNIQFERSPENNKKTTFDRIRITCNLINSLDFFNELNDDDINKEKTIINKQTAYIKKNSRHIAQFIFNTL